MNNHAASSSLNCLAMAERVSVFAAISAVPVAVSIARLRLAPNEPDSISFCQAAMKTEAENDLGARNSLD
jgi:hypothetical protein